MSDGGERMREGGAGEVKARGECTERGEGTAAAGFCERRQGGGRRERKHSTENRLIRIFSKQKAMNEQKTMHEVDAGWTRRRIFSKPNE